MGPKLYPLFCHSCLLVLQGVGVAVDAFEVATFRQCPHQFYADGIRRIVIMCYQEFVGKTVMVFHSGHGDRYIGSLFRVDELK